MADKLTPKPRGRPVKHTAAIAESICKLLSAGETLRQVCKRDDMPAESTVRGWALDDQGGFAAQYSRAREIGYHSMADELLDISDDGTNDYMERQTDDGSTGDSILNGEHIQRSRLRVDSRKWLLSKALPKIYGDKIEVEQTNFNVTIEGDDADL